MNILYYVSVLLMCVHYCGNDPALDRFLQGLKEVLLRHAFFREERRVVDIDVDN